MSQDVGGVLARLGACLGDVRAAPWLAASGLVTAAGFVVGVGAAAAAWPVTKTVGEAAAPLIAGDQPSRTLVGTLRLLSVLLVLFVLSVGVEALVRAPATAVVARRVRSAGRVPEGRTADDADAGDPSPSTALRAAGDRLPAVVGAALLGRVVALAVAVALLFVLLTVYATLGTAVEAAGYALGLYRDLPVWVPFGAVGLAAVLAWAGGTAAVALAVPAAAGPPGGARAGASADDARAGGRPGADPWTRSPVEAVRASLRYARQVPRSAVLDGGVLVQSLLVPVLLTGGAFGVGAAVAGDVGSPVATVLALPTAALAMTAGGTLTALYRVRTYDAVVVPTLADADAVPESESGPAPEPPDTGDDGAGRGPPPEAVAGGASALDARRTARWTDRLRTVGSVVLVAVLVGGSLAAGGWVRVADVRPAADGPPGPVGADDPPRATMAAGFDALARVDHEGRVRESSRNRSAGGAWNETVRVRTVVDHSDRQYLTVSALSLSDGGSQVVGQYVEHGTFARVAENRADGNLSLPDGAGPDGTGPWPADRARTRARLLPVETVTDVSSSYGANWTVVDVDDGTVVYRSRARRSVGQFLSYPRELVRNGTVTVTVDARTGLVRRVEARAVVRRTEDGPLYGYRRVRTLSYGGDGDVDVRRPAPVLRPPLAVLLDALRY